MTTRRCLGLSIAFFACLVLRNAVLAQESSLPRSWKGRYAYAKDDRAGVPFTLEITSLQGANFSGRTTEQATFGKKPCSTVHANVEGQFTGRTVTFTKRYDGTCGQNHSVQYSGRVDKQFSAMWVCGV